MSHFTEQEIARVKQEREFLEGPRSRGKELTFSFKVLKEFIKGFKALHFVGPCVTIFGSARFKEDHPYYQLAREAGARVSDMGFTVMTGGGPGVMEAANRGAYETGGRSIGCNIVLPHEQSHNPYMHKWVTFNYFFVRKYLLFKYSYAFMVMPGGMGTMDEMFEALTLIQTGKISNFPVVVMGVEYWKDLREMLETMADEHTIDKEDMDLILFTDSMDEAIAHIQKYAVDEFGLKKTRQMKPHSWLGEFFFKKNGN